MIDRLMFVAEILTKNDIKSVPQGDFNEGSALTLLKLFFGLAGAVAVLIVTLAGFKFVLARGNPQELAKARNTIIDALIGLIICISAFSIVNFFITRI